ncbi:MAG: hypothetical protein HZA08_08875 [Nitrospirae bacterium]|nr:hypothetical protein [Nitrospirota bacterium]
MKNLAIDDRLYNLIKELNFNDVEDLIKDSLITEVLYKISDYSGDVDFFEKKYGKGFNEFKIEYETGEEDFSRYDDLITWEFTQKGKEYWTKKIEELKSVL